MSHFPDMGDFDLSEQGLQYVKELLLISYVLIS